MGGSRRRGVRGNRRFEISLLLSTFSRCCLGSVLLLLSTRLRRLKLRLRRLKLRLRRLKLRARLCKLMLDGRELRLERSLDSSPRALASLSNYTRLVRTDMSPCERPLRPRGTAATTRPTPRAPAAFRGWRSSATPRTAAWLQLERLVEGLRQCVSRYHI